MRERDVRNAIQTALLATNTFSNVWLTGLPEDYGQGASDLMAAAIEPDSTTQTDRYDGGRETELVATARVNITLLARNPDAQLRDEAVEQLLNAAINAIQGQSLAGLTVPDLTRFLSWKWQPPKPPERRITAVFTFDYLVFGWGEYDATE